MKDTNNDLLMVAPQWRNEVLLPEPRTVEVPGEVRLVEVLPESFGQ